MITYCFGSLAETEGAFAPLPIGTHHLCDAKRSPRVVGSQLTRIPDAGRCADQSPPQRSGPHPETFNETDLRRTWLLCLLSRPKQTISGWQSCHKPMMILYRRDVDFRAQRRPLRQALRCRFNVQLRVIRSARPQMADARRGLPRRDLVQSSICSEMVSASSTSTPRYWTVLSILAWPRRIWTARRLPVRL